MSDGHLIWRRPTIANYDRVGGETALKKGDGDMLKVRGPAMGCAVVMQGKLPRIHHDLALADRLLGRYITHQALRALGAQERITMVTSFRPKDPFKADDSVLETVRPISNLSELYFEFSEYRMAVLEERIRKQLAAIRERHRGGKSFSSEEFKSFLTMKFLKSESNPEECPAGLLAQALADSILQLLVVLYGYELRYFMIDVQIYSVRYNIGVDFEVQGHIVEAGEGLEYGKNYEGYWDGEKFVFQV